MKPRSLLLIGIMVGSLFLGKILLSTFLFPGVLGKMNAPEVALAQSQPVAAPLLKPSAGNSDPTTPEALKEREQKVKQQEAELLPLKKEIEEKLAELNELQAGLAAYAKKLAEREKALQDVKMTHLVDLYSSMEPANAAAIMGKLKIETVVLILRHMKGKSAGLILGQMKPDTGAAISERLSQMMRNIIRGDG
jgi:flagellar motility protein MotE (MotC chaperone)